MNITLAEARRFRRMNKEELRCAHILCRHSEKHHTLYSNVILPDTTYTDLMRCRKCLRWWISGEPIPNPGNPALAPFTIPCKHYRCRTLPGTDDMNQCMECDEVFDKSDAAIAWKRLRSSTNSLIGRAYGFGKDTHTQLQQMMYDSSGKYFYEYIPRLI